MKIYVDELPNHPIYDCLFYNRAGTEDDPCLFCGCHCGKGCPLTILPGKEETDDAE